MRISNLITCLSLVSLLLYGCAGNDPIRTVTPLPTEMLTEIVNENPRALLTYSDLMDGFEADAPVDEGALTPPSEPAPTQHTFEGRLLLIPDETNAKVEIVRGELDPEYRSLPIFDIQFVQSNGYLIPVQRGVVIPEHPGWNYIIEPGRVWQEAGDQGYTRASFPFALVVKGGNATFNGTMAFLFDDRQVSKAWYQVTQETTTYDSANMWGLLDAVYQPEKLENGEQAQAAFEAELANRFPTKPIQALFRDHPEVNVAAFGSSVTPEYMTWYGFVVDGVNYIGGCRTRFGTYPYCDSMRVPSYSTAKSAFASVALMRLAQLYGPEVADLLIKDYVPEYVDSVGDWEQVTFNNTIDMATGNFESGNNMVDENSPKMNWFFGVRAYDERIAKAFDWPHNSEPGEKWVYHTSDTFILTRAMQNYLRTQQDPDADIFEFVVEEVYKPLKLGPGAMSSMRTEENNWHGQAEGGFGLWFIPDDIAKISTLLNNDGGQIDGVQVLQPDLLAQALQQDPDDRGVTINANSFYNNAFWANKYSGSNFSCEFWVSSMQGVSGNVVVLMPNGTTYYHFSDNQEFSWDSALYESNRISPLCP